MKALVYVIALVVWFLLIVAGINMLNDVMNIGLAYALTASAWSLASFVICWWAAGLIYGCLTPQAEKRFLPEAAQCFIYKVAEVSAKDLAIEAGRFIANYPVLSGGLVFVVLAGFTTPSEGSLPPTAQAVYHATNVAGIIWLCWTALWGALTGAASAGSAAVSDVVGSAVSLIERLILLVVGLIVIRMFGVEVSGALVWMKHNPDAVLAAVAGMIVVRSLFALAPSRSMPVARDSQPVAYGIAVSRRLRSAKDIRRTAIHEAGHLVYYADLPELPADLSVKVLEKIGAADMFRGQVSSPGVWPSEQTEGFMRWWMQMNLAGSEAEFVLLQERGDGADGDNSRWLHTAKNYLKAGFGEVFYAEPSGEAEQAHNRAVLNALKATHVDAVRARLLSNKEVVAELAEAIAERKVMKLEEIAPYLSRIV